MSRKPPWVHSRKTNSRYAGMSVPYTTCAATQPVSPGFVPSDTDRNYHLPAPFPAKDGMIPAILVRQRSYRQSQMFHQERMKQAVPYDYTGLTANIFYLTGGYRDMKPVTGTSHVTQLAKSYTRPMACFIIWVLSSST